jgi:hypothetical protein
MPADPLACPLCGHVRKPSDPGSFTTCPSCGLVFSEYKTSAKVGPQSYLDASLTKQQLLLSLFVGAIVGSFGGIALIDAFKHFFEESKDFQTLVMLGVYLPIISIPIALFLCSFFVVSVAFISTFLARLLYPVNRQNKL